MWVHVVSQPLTGGFSKDVIGYCDPLSARPGENIHFKISSFSPGPAALCLVKLISGDDRPHGTGLIEDPVDAGLPREVDLVQQPLIPGSYGLIQDLPALTHGKFEVWLYPTLVRPEPQCIANMGNVQITINDAGFAACTSAGEVHIGCDVPLRRWYQLQLDFGDELTLSVLRRGSGIGEADRSWSATRPISSALTQGEMVLAARAPGVEHFNGRLEAPRLTQGDDVEAAWDFSQAISTQRIADTSGNDHDGRLFQTPTRGVCGVAWDGSAQSHLEKPEHYGAIHFHEDDLTDAGWKDTVSWRVPADLPSGQYALKVLQGESEDYIPCFVRPPEGKRGSDLVYLVPTASYLAYANQRLGFTSDLLGRPSIRYANDAFLHDHEEVGYSLYEYHRDGSGVHFSSRLRPVLNLKPRNDTWAFNADTHITAWLEATDKPFDVLTDEDLHLEGAQALSGYRTVITGTHPEYYSTRMRDALSGWLGDGGRLMYMGGNGFYWRIAHDPANPAIIEVRRAEDGTRAWIAEPGEYYHQFSGEYGGLWRRLGHPPNELVGIGFAAQGFDGGTHYRLKPGALDARVAFVMEGVEQSDILGNYGNQGGGAAGEEIDRWDVHLGSPAHAVIIATSEDHKPGMLRVKEEFHMTQPLRSDPKVRADMVFFELPSGGAVFSTGSISYAGSLAHNNYDNDIARLTGNVLNRFLDPTPFEMP